METMTCPSCNEDVPVVATRCKHCFHDFTKEPATSKNSMLGLVTLIATMLVIGTAVFWYVNNHISASNAIDNYETQQFLFAHKTANETDVITVSFSDVSRIEYVQGGETAEFEVVVVTNSDARHVLQSSPDKSLRERAERVALKVGNARGNPCQFKEVKTRKNLLDDMEK